MLTKFNDRLQHRFHGLLLLLTLLLMGGCCSVAPTSQPHATLYQYSTLQALIEGVYDGDCTLAELRRHGNFGIGTFNSLDGEMILFDGAFYQVRADGNVYRPDNQTQTPFAAVVDFASEASSSWPVPAGLDYAAFQKWLDEILGAPQNQPISVLVDARFERVKTRSVPAQSKPYPRLTDVTKEQPVFEMTSVDGQLIGFRLPAYLSGINVPGYHLHFLSADRTQGGHLLDFKTIDGRVSVCRQKQLSLVLPSTDAFHGADLSDDKQADVHAVEQ